MDTSFSPCNNDLYNKEENNKKHGNGKKKSSSNGKLSTDRQSVAARERRHRISDRFKILQSLVPGGSKMDTVSMLDGAIHYVNFLKAQIWLHETMIDFVSSAGLRRESAATNFVSSDDYYCYNNNSNNTNVPNNDNGLLVGTSDYYHLASNDYCYSQFIGDEILDDDSDQWLQAADPGVAPPYTPPQRVIVEGEVPLQAEAAETMSCDEYVMYY